MHPRGDEMYKEGCVQEYIQEGKLEPKIKIIGKVGSVAYRLELLVQYLIFTRYSIY